MNMRLFREGVLKARNHIALILGLILGTVLVYELKKLETKFTVPEVTIKIEKTAPQVQWLPSPLTPEERLYAQIAWRYFENNYQKNTGLVNSVDGFPSTTLWDTGNYLMALISAYKLNLIDKTEFDKRLHKILDTFCHMPFYNHELPNKAYDTRTAQMVDYTNKPTEKGIGWSAIDIGRVLIPLSIINWEFPQYNAQIRQFLKRFKLKHLAQKGMFFGMKYKRGKESLLQEGRLGYEQFTAKMFAALGIDATNALDYKKFLGFVDIYGIKVPYDKRDKKHSGANNYVLSEPYILDGLEFGWDHYSKEFAYRVYKAQEERYKHTGILTAVTEDHLDRPPYFIYNCVFVNGEAWQAITDKGEKINALKLLSTKASFGWYYLFHTDYTKKFVKRIKNLYNKNKGWYAGVYEKTGEINRSINCNTNAVILEALYFKTHGPIFRLMGKNAGGD